MSGVSLGPWATPFEDPLERARKHAYYLGANAKDVEKWTPQELVDFMRSQDAADITESETNLRVYNICDLFVFMPYHEFN